MPTGRGDLGDEDDGALGARAALWVWGGVTIWAILLIGYWLWVLLTK